MASFKNTVTVELLLNGIEQKNVTIKIDIRSEITTFLSISFSN